MKIFIIGNVASMMINFRKELIEELVENGIDVYCLVSDYTEITKNQVKDLGAIPLDYELNSKGLNPFKDIIATYKLYKLIKEHKPDIVFSFFVKPVIFGSMAAKFAKIPRVVGMIEGLGGAFTVHKNGITRKAKIIKFIQALLYKFSLPKLDLLIFLNPDDKKDLVEKYNIKVKQILILGGIGVDLDKFKYSLAPTNPVSFIFIARLLAEKGIFEYLKAAKMIKAKYPQTKFYIFGSFDEENPFALKKDELEQYLKDDLVIYPGFVDNIHEWLTKTSVFVLPSYYREGVPRSTQEAMAIGRAIITTNVAGCKETVINGYNGFLIPPFDSHILAEKMEYFINNPECINQMGKDSRKLAEDKFDVKKVNKKLINALIYNKF
ncbi:glycosyltransferase family 4 protein [Campylobacter sputorum]|uniref:glycosyltransferase family 4 protein n=1 Tax=Campylobacter sputorum TaxID=206 RepID=UPI001896798E|nr:glycosyltransferase family 4 protein [Campylobacter sp. RM11259]MBF6677318.1 glycosyltransferase family 4 protein [Campylobacter sp. RM11259]